MRPNSSETRAGANSGRRRFALGLAVTAVVGMLVGCSLGTDSGEDSAPFPGSTPTMSSDPDPGDSDGQGGAEQPSEDPDESADALAALEAFRNECAQGVQNWRAAQVDYPDDLTVGLNESVDYNAAVDINDEPLPPDQVIETDGGSATAEAVQVRCTVAARVVPVGDALTIEEQASELAGGWILQEFTPTGIVEWSWTVTAIKPVDQDLRLELRPAIVLNSTSSLDELYSSASQASFSTEVHVEANPVQSMGYWFTTNWGAIAAIAAAIGGATLAVLAWMRKVRNEARALKNPPHSAEGE